MLNDILKQNDEDDSESDSSSDDSEDDCKILPELLWMDLLARPFRFS
jgi:hypothetical protein